MKNELKISTLSIVCALCAAVSMPAYGAPAVRSLGGAGTYSSASNAAAARVSTGGALGSLRGGALRVNNTASNANKKPSVGSTGGRTATTPRLSIGKYLGGATTVKNNTMNKDELDNALAGLHGNLQERIRVLEAFMGFDENDDNIPEQFDQVQLDLDKLKTDLESLSAGVITDVTYADGVLTVVKDGEDLTYDLTADFAAKSEVAALETALDDLSNKMPSIAGLATEQQLADLQAALEALIDEKQDKGSFADKAALEKLAADVADLQSGAATSSDVAKLQDQVNEIAADYATKDELSAAETRLQEAIGKIDLTPYALAADVAAQLALKADKAELDAYTKTEDLARVAITGSYTDLINVPTDLINQSTLDAVQQALEAAIDAKQDAGQFADKAALEELKAAVEGLQSGSATNADFAELKEKVTAIESSYAKSADMTAADAALQASIDDLAAEIEAIDLTVFATKDDVALKADQSALNDLADLVDVNAEDIETNAAAIESVQGSVDGLLTDMTDAKQNISDLQTADAGMAGDIAKNAEDIATNLEYIESNADAIADINTELDGLADVAKTGSYDDLDDKPDMTQYVTNETIQQNYVTNTALEEKKYLTEQKAADTYLTEQQASQTYVTEQQVTNALNSYEIPDNSITAAKLKDGAVTAEKIDTELGEGEMVMLMSNGDGTSSWVSVGLE